MTIESEMIDLQFEELEVRLRDHLAERSEARLVPTANPAFPLRRVAFLAVAAAFLGAVVVGSNQYRSSSQGTVAVDRPVGATTDGTDAPSAATSTTMNPRFIIETEGPDVDLTMEKLGITHEDLADRFVGQHFGELDKFVKEHQPYYSVLPLVTADDGSRRPFGSLPGTPLLAVIDAGRITVEVGSDGVVVVVSGWG